MELDIVWQDILLAQCSSKVSGRWASLASSRKPFEGLMNTPDAEAGLAKIGGPVSVRLVRPAFSN